ncbi:hypothetical protein [Nonomuraea fuscirosea]
MDLQSDMAGACGSMFGYPAEHAGFVAPGDAGIDETVADGEKVLPGEAQT